MGRRMRRKNPLLNGKQKDLFVKFKEEPRDSFARKREMHPNSAAMVEERQEREKEQGRRKRTSWDQVGDNLEKMVIDEISKELEKKEKPLPSPLPPLTPSRQALADSILDMTPQEWLLHPDKPTLYLDSKEHGKIILTASNDIHERAIAEERVVFYPLEVAEILQAEKAGLLTALLIRRIMETKKTFPGCDVRSVEEVKDEGKEDSG